MTHVTSTNIKKALEGFLVALECWPSDPTWSSSEEGSDYTSARTPWWSHNHLSLDGAIADAALQVWLDERTSQVIMRVEGLLNEATERFLLARMGEVLGNGARQIVVDTSAMDIGDVWGAGALVVCKRLAHVLGAELLWEGLDITAQNPDCLRT
jgi:hypothetical protein